MPLNVPDGRVDDWLASLKPFQRSALEQFMKNGSAEDAARTWLTTLGSPNIAAFGGASEKDPKPFWNRFQAELRRFVCDDSAYVEEKKLLLNEAGTVKAVWIAAVAAAMGATLGFSATLLAPPVAIMLSAIARMGINAYCKAPEAASSDT